MSYTIHQQPSEYTPAYNSHIYVVGSTNYTQPQFKYVAKVYVGSNVLTFKEQPDPTFNNVYFDFGRTVESLVSYTIDNVAGFATCDSSISSYYVEFYEEYEVSGVVTLSALMATGNTIKIWNGIVSPLDYQSYTQDDYLIDATSKALNHNLTREVTITDHAWLYYLVNDLTYSDKAIINAYDDSGSLLSATEVSNGTSGSHMIKFSCGPAGLNAVVSGDILTGSQPIIPATTARYTIQFDGSGASITYNFTIADYCDRYEVYRLHYLNSKGAFDSFNFSLVSDREEDVTRETYKKVVGGLTSATTYGYSKSDVVQTTSYTQITDKYKVRTNWLSQEYSDELAQLVDSPCVFWDHPDYGLVSINISDTKYKYAKKSSKKSIMLEVNFSTGFDRYRQRG